jgi:hypothetical protein
LIERHHSAAKSLIRGMKIMKRSTALLTGAGLLFTALAATGGYFLFGRGEPRRPVITMTPEAAQQRAERCAVIKASVTEAGFADKVSIDCDQWQAHLISDSYPDHDLMNGIIGTIERPYVASATSWPCRPGFMRGILLLARFGGRSTRPWRKHMWSAH